MERGGLGSVSHSSWMVIVPLFAVSWKKFADIGTIAGTGPGGPM